MSDEATYRRELRAAHRALCPKIVCACGCGAVFTPTRSGHRFHTAACRQRAHRTPRRDDASEMDGLASRPSSEQVNADQDGSMRNPIILHTSTPEELAEAIKRSAEAEDRSTSSWLRRAAQRELERQAERDNREPVPA
jgi:hypothetical protein